MKVLVHLNDDQKKSVLIDVKSRVTTKALRKMLHVADERMLTQLLSHADKIREIPLVHIKAAEALADFTVSRNRYTIEKLV